MDSAGVDGPTAVPAAIDIPGLLRRLHARGWDAWVEKRERWGPNANVLIAAHPATGDIGGYVGSVWSLPFAADPLVAYASELTWWSEEPTAENAQAIRVQLPDGMDFVDALADELNIRLTQNG